MSWYKQAQSQFYNDLVALFPIFAQKAQEEYDSWLQDSEGYDEELGHGGICHLIAEPIADVIYSSIPYVEYAATTSCDWEQHVYVSTYILSPEKEGYVIDVPYSQYETGGGFTWKKIPEVKFDASYVTIREIDTDEIDYLNEGEY